MHDFLSFSSGRIESYTHVAFNQDSLSPSTYHAQKKEEKPHKLQSRSLMTSKQWRKKKFARGFIFFFLFPDLTALAVSTSKAAWTTCCSPVAAWQRWPTTWTGCTSGKPWYTTGEWRRKTSIRLNRSVAVIRYPLCLSRLPSSIFKCSFSLIPTLLLLYLHIRLPCV